jgi:hypothetical protein
VGGGGGGGVPFAPGGGAAPPPRTRAPRAGPPTPVALSASLLVQLDIS